MESYQNYQNQVDVGGKNTPRDTLLYLASLILLLTVTISFGILVFQIINHYFPDVISPDYYSSSYQRDGIIASLSVLIIVFPIFYFVLRFIRRDMVQYPEKKNIWVRKWLLYLTLFVAAGVMIGDLVAIFRGFLGGELTIRFFLKFLTILFIAGASFYYYFAELKNIDYSKIKWLAWLVVTVFVLSIIFGIYTVGLPQNQRSMRLDEQRVQDLQMIQNQIGEYWRTNRVIPDKLDDLNNAFSGFVVPRDPTTGNSYEYTVIDSKVTFKLCAIFETSNQDSSYSPEFPRDIGGKYFIEDGNSYWLHSAGRVCFDRSIDPKLFPLNVVPQPNRPD